PLRPVARLTGRVTPTAVRPHLKGVIEIVGTAPANSPAPGRLVLNGLVIEGSARVLPGNLAELEIAHSTLPPQAATLTSQGNDGLALTLTRVICGDLKPGAGARSLHLVESIVDGDVDALALTIDGCTVLGETK